jgi:hypothetical protein
VDDQPRSGGRSQNRPRERLIARAAAPPAGALGCAAAVWWRRVAPPPVPAGTAEDPPLRLVEPTGAPNDPAPQARAGSGLVRRRAQQDAAVGRRVVEGRPLRALTTPFRDGWCAKLAARGVAVWGWIGDPASGHVSPAVRTGIRAHHRALTPHGRGIRIRVCSLPVTSPWLTPSEPTWVHRKRALVEPTRLLSAQEVAARVCADQGCPHAPHLSLPDPVLDQAC